MRVRIIGAGNIGTALAREAAELGLAVEVADARPERARALAEAVGGDVVEPDAELSEVDLIVEAASQPAVAGAVLDALTAGVDCLVMTSGAFLKPGLLDRARSAMAKSGARLHVPSGGISGLDAVKALALQEGATVRLTTRKPPTSLGLPGDHAGELFSGTAQEAVEKFPKNVNVAATLALAGLSPQVRVVADPSLERNTHEVEVTSDTVKVSVTVQSDPSPENPATSHVAVLSARAMLRRLVSDIQVGT